MAGISAAPTPREVSSESKFLSTISANNSTTDATKTGAPGIEIEVLNEDSVIESNVGHQTRLNRNSRSSSSSSSDDLLRHDVDNDARANRRLIEGDDLEAASASYYRDNDHAKNDFALNSFGELLNSQDDSSKIIGVRVTSSVAVVRGNTNNNNNNNSNNNNNNPITIAEPQAPINSNADVETLQPRKIKSNGNGVNKFTDDSPTTWRPFRPAINRDYYKGVPSNRHTISTLPGGMIGANPDYILQQKEREFQRNKQEQSLHPYQRAIIYQNQPKNVQRPRSFSYSSVINRFGDPKHSTTNDWSSSTHAESVATESSAGYVTIINHNGNNVVEHEKTNHENDLNIKSSLDSVDKIVTSESIGSPNIHQSISNSPQNFNEEPNIPNVPPTLPHIYSEPAKIYSEPAKVYGEPSKVYGKPEMIYSEPAKFYSEPAKVYGEPSKIYGEPSKVYSEPAKIYGEPAKVYSQPATVYPHAFVTNLEQEQHYVNGVETSTRANQNYQNIGNRYENLNDPSKLEDQKNYNDTKMGREPFERGRRPGEQNYEVDESVSVNTNGRIHGVQQKPQDDKQKVGYVVEGRNYRKYRVEERTPDGYIVGEYGEVGHNDGSLRAVRYTADITANPRLIQDALMRFLSLQ